MTRSGDIASALFEMFAPENIEMIIMNQSEFGCSGDWYTDLEPGSFDIKVNGIQINKCAPRSTEPDWRSLMIGVDVVGSTTDIGSLAGCPLNTADFGEAIEVEVHGHNPATGNEFCLSFLSPGTVHITMDELGVNHYGSSVRLRQPTSGEFILYEATTGCAGWVKDIYPSSTVQVSVDGTVIVNCAPRSTNADWSSLHFNLSGAGIVSNSGIQVCPGL